MDKEFKKLLEGDSWAQDGDRVDPESSALQPVIDRGVGWGADYSTTETPYRMRMNQIFRELTGAAKEVAMGVSQYDREVAYKKGSVTNVAGSLFVATADHDPNNHVNPLTDGQTLWTEIGSRGGAARTAPDVVSAGNIFILAENANSFRAWWAAPDNGGYDIDRTDLEWSTDSQFRSTPPSGTVSGSVNDYQPGAVVTLTGTTTVDEVWVRIQSRNFVGPSGWTNPSARVSSSPVVPRRIDNLIAETRVGSGAVKLTWTAPDMRGNPNPTNYYIQRKTSGGSYDNAVDGPNTTTVAYPATSRTISGLTNDTAYTFRIFTDYYDSTNYSSLPQQVEVTATPEDFPTVPGATSITVSRASPTSIQGLVDSIPTSPGDDISSFEWNWRLSTNTEWTSKNTDEAYILIDSLTNGSTYQVRCRAYNGVGDSSGTGAGGAGYGPWSTTSNVTLTTIAKPAAPRIQAYRDRTNSVDTVFMTSDIADVEGQPNTNAQIRAKQKSRTDSSFPTDWTFTFPAPNFSLNVSAGYNVSREYQMRVYNSAGWGPWSSSIFVNPLVLSPSRPNSIDPLRVESNKIDVYFTSTITDGGAPIDQYQVQYKRQDLSDPTRNESGFRATNPTSSFGKVAITLESDDRDGDNFQVQGRVRNRAGEYSPWSPTFTSAPFISSVPTNRVPGKAIVFTDRTGDSTANLFISTETDFGRPAWASNTISLQYRNDPNGSWVTYGNSPVYNNGRLTISGTAVFPNSASTPQIRLKLRNSEGLAADWSDTVTISAVPVPTPANRVPGKARIDLDRTSATAGIINVLAPTDLGVPLPAHLEQNQEVQYRQIRSTPEPKDHAK